MSEYAKYNGKSIKIGTCESMYYLRYEDRYKVQAESHSLNPATTLNLFWRLPFPDEDSNGPGNYPDYKRGLRLYRMVKDRMGHDYAEDFPSTDLTDNPGIIQLKHECGLLVNIPCYHGAKLPECGDAKTFWNGKSWFIELLHIKNTAEGVLPIIGCRHCGSMWRCSWDEVMPYIHDEKLAQRLSVHVGKVAA